MVYSTLLRRRNWRKRYWRDLILDQQATALEIVVLIFSCLIPVVSNFSPARYHNAVKYWLG